MDKQVLRMCDFQGKKEMKRTMILRMCAEGDFHPPFSLRRAVTIAGVNVLICFFALTLVSWYTGTAQANLTIPAVVGVTPDILNLKSGGEWITANIRLPEGYDVADIDAWSIRLNGDVCVALKTGMDADLHTEKNNDVLKVKFDRSEVSHSVGLSVGEKELKVSGSLVTGEPFEGNVIIQVVCPGKSLG